MTKYPRITVNGKRFYGHRAVMEAFIGRTLESYEEIHHINGNKTDNRIKNLIILSKSEHSTFHSNKESYNHICKKCQNNFKGLKMQQICSKCRSFKCKWCEIIKIQKFHRKDRMNYCSKKCRNNAASLRFKINPPNIGRIPWNKK